MSHFLVNQSNEIYQLLIHEFYFHRQKKFIFSHSFEFKFIIKLIDNLNYYLHLTFIMI